MVLQGNRALFGPPPATLLDPVPPGDLGHAIVAGIPGLIADLDADTTNVLLTLARIWTTLATGAICAKDQAADWVIERLPAVHRASMAHARDVYLGSTPDGCDGLPPDVHRLTHHLLTRIGDAQGA